MHYAISILLFVILPVFNILVYIMMLTTGVESGLLFSYMTFYVTLSVLILISFLTVLLDEFEILKQEHSTTILRKKEAQHSLSKGFEIDGVNSKEEEINEEILKLGAH